MASKLHIELSQSPHLYGEDFILEQDERGWISWVGAGRFEGDRCGFESDRKLDAIAADAVFRLAMADGQDVAEAVLTVFGAGLPTDGLNLEYLDYE